MSALARTKYEVISLNNIDVTVDVSLLSKDVLWFNATDIAKRFDKRPVDWLKTEPAKEYIQEVLSESGSDSNHFENLVRITKGGKYQGTWLHKELAFEFAGWCSAAFRRKLHKWAEQRLAEEHQRRQHRLELRTGFLPLTNAIQATHDTEEFYHYSTEANMINRLVTGMDAKKFKEVHGVKNVRDALSAEQAQEMNKLQRQNTSLIELGFSYDERKRLLQHSILIR
jgi:hypothetical protein